MGSLLWDLVVEVPGIMVGIPDGDGGRRGREGIQQVRGYIGDGRTMKKIRGVDTKFKTAENADETVITLETSPATMPTAWVNFLKQRFHLLGVEYNYIGAGRIVLTTSPRTAESVVRLLISAIEIANDHVKTVGR